MLKNFFECDYRKWLDGEKIEIAFLFQAATVWPSWESIYEECLRDDRIMTKVILLRGAAVELSHTRGAEEYLINKKIDYIDYNTLDMESFCPHIAFVQFPYDALFHLPEVLSLKLRSKGIRIVYIPYGIEIADTPAARNDHFNSRVVENAWRIFTSSHGLLSEYYEYCRNRDAVRVTGSPKFDGIHFKERYPLKDAIREKAAGRKIVVWKIHFPKSNRIDGKAKQITPEISEYRDFANRLEQFKSLFFIVLPHPNIFCNEESYGGKKDVSLAGEMRSIIKSLEILDNTYIDTGVDYRNSLYNADAIIIDRSGVMIEAAMLDVPILLMRNSGYDEPLTVPVEETMAECYQGSGSCDMVSFIFAFSEDKLKKNAKRFEMIERWFPFHDGKCGKRILETIIEDIDSESKEPENTPSRIVLYGAGDIATYYINNKDKYFKNVDIVAVADADKKKQNKTFIGYEIISPNEIRDIRFDAVVIMTEKFFYEIQKYLIYELKISDRKILRLDEFLVLMND